MAHVKRRIRVTLTTAVAEDFARIVEEGHYMNRQAAMRAALRRLLLYHRIKPFVLSGARCRRSF